MSEALFLQHGATGPPALLAEWADDRGVAYAIHRSDLDEPLPAVGGQAFVASLGAPHNPEDRDPYIAAELAFLGQAVEHGVPVLGLCFGGQMLAKVLGATIEQAPAPELGWGTIESAVPDQVPAGPWLHWHYDRFTLPPGAEALATSRAGVQAFRSGPHLGVQFHPESTIEVVRGWAAKDLARGRATGIGDGVALLESGREHAPAAAAAAFTLFDAFWERAKEET